MNTTPNEGSKDLRFDQRDPGKTLATVLPGITKEQAQIMAKNFFALWPEAKSYLERSGS